MARRSKKPGAGPVELLPPPPLDADHWRAIFKAMRLSPRQITVVDLVLRGCESKEIAEIMDIAEPTIKTYLQRIYARTGARGRMELAMHVLALSHEVNRDGMRRPQG